MGFILNFWKDIVELTNFKWFKYVKYKDKHGR